MLSHGDVAFSSCDRSMFLRTIHRSVSVVGRYDWISFSVIFARSMNTFCMGAVTSTRPLSSNPSQRRASGSSCSGAYRCRLCQGVLENLSVPRLDFEIQDVLLVLHYYLFVTRGNQRVFSPVVGRILCCYI